MNFAQFAAVMGEIEAGREVDLSYDDATDFLDIARQYGTPLSYGVLNTIKAVLQRHAPEGFDHYVEHDPVRTRFVWRKKGGAMQWDDEAEPR